MTRLPSIVVKKSQQQTTFHNAKATIHWSNKISTTPKAYNLSMEYQNEMRPKGLVRGHLMVSKTSKNTSKSSKLKKLCIVEVGHVSKIAKSQLSPKLQILPNGPIFFTWFEFSLLPTFPSYSHVSISHIYYLIWFLFELIHFKSNQIT